MTSPLFGSQDALSLDALMARVRGESPMDGIDRLMGEMNPSANIATPGDVARFFYGLSQSDQGRAVLEWLADITVRRIEPMPAGSMEQVMIFAVAKQRDQQLMLTLCQAIEEGEQLVKIQQHENQE